MQISFPAMEGIIGGRKYYSCLMKLSTIPKMLTFSNPKQQNKRHESEVAKYILDNEDSYVLPSITAYYKCEVEFIPHAIGNKTGDLRMKFEDATFFVNDDQSRCAGIAAAIAENKTLGEEMIPVLLFPHF